MRGGMVLAERNVGFIGKYSRGAVRVFAVFESNQIGNICWREIEGEGIEKVRGQKAEHVCECVCVCCLTVTVMCHKPTKLMKNVKRRHKRKRNFCTHTHREREQGRESPTQTEHKELVGNGCGCGCACCGAYAKSGTAKC